MIKKILVQVFQKASKEIESSDENELAEHISYVLTHVHKKSISVKTISRHRNKYILGSDKINLNASGKTKDSYCIYLGYKGYSDFCVHNQSKDVELDRKALPDLHKIDYNKEDTHHEWMVYEVAFLWYDVTPPGIEAHFHLMNRDVEKKKLELHSAIERGLLDVKLEYHILGEGFTRYVTREAVLEYAKRIGEKPRFLFKEER